MKIEFENNFIEYDDRSFAVYPKTTNHKSMMIYFYHNNSLADIGFVSIVENRTFKAERCIIDSDYYDKVIVKIAKLINKRGIKITVYKEDNETIIYEMSDNILNYFKEEN